MASAQVLPNSASAKKQEHLEAGKRRLEEFRKKKAAERAKKVASASHSGTDNVDRHDKQHLDNQHVRLTDSNGAGTSDGVREAVVEPSRGVNDNDSNVIEVVQTNELGSSVGHAIPPLRTNYYNAFSKESVQEPPRNKEFESNISQSAGTVNVNYHPYTREKNDKYGISAGASGRHAYGTTNDQSVDFRPQMIQENDDNSGQPGHYGLQEAHLEDNDSYLNSHIVASLGTSLNSGGIIPSNKSDHASLVGGLRSSYEDNVSPSTKIRESSLEVGQNMHAVPEFSDAMISDIWGKKRSNPTGNFPSENSKPLWLSESQSNAFTFDSGSSSNHAPLYPAVGETNTRRSRPSFLDSINMPRVPLSEPGRGELFSSKIHDMDVVVSSASDKSFTETQTNQYFSKYGAPYEASGALEHSLTPSVSAGIGGHMYRHNVNENSMESKYDSYSQKQDEDFAALEQHIEDLTQEKFSLQRALEASRTLAESLAAENSSLTDSFNQQGSVVNQLKSEMDKLQEEIKTQLMELESIKIEYANAQLECNAADERAKLLASEVIGLEEKALRLRSSELKLERQLENSEAEISSFKKKLSSLEKDRQDLQSTIDALQDEKKLLQAKLWKASANGTSAGVSKSLTNKKDVSTSTEDLVHEDDTDAETGTSNLEMYSVAPLLGSDASTTSFPPENRHFNVEVSSSNIPPDQMRMVQNIHTLISELALEKEELMQAVLAESSESSKLKELNKELSRKLEAQTQRLELLTAQSMANENIPTRLADPHIMPDSTPYADEGDEVVERVLGWIMKLFPGGPSRRRTSKLL